MIGFKNLNDIKTSSLILSSDVEAKKALISTHFAENSTLFGMGRGGGGGGVTSFTNITGKVPTLLTSIVYPLLVATIFLTKRSWRSF